MSDSTSRVADALAEVATTIHRPRTVEERLDEVVRTAPGTVPGFDHASVSVAYRDGPVETRAASNDLVRDLDLRQYETHEGPCFEAFDRVGVLLAPTLREERRWPNYVPRAVEAGITAQMAVHLVDAGGVRGALNFYATEAEGIDPEAPGIAVLFATHAALALGSALREEQLNSALMTRKTIGQAIGILMERYQIDEDKAFGFLTRVSQTSNVKVKDVAQELLTQTDARYTPKDAR